MTPTGSERIRALFGEQVQHCYLPYDLPWAAARFLDRVRPRLAVIMETELWPNHIHQCARRGIPVALGQRAPVRAFGAGYARFAGLTRPMLAEMSWFAVQTEAEAQRFRDLGARPDCVSVTGSIVRPEHRPATAGARRCPARRVAARGRCGSPPAPMPVRTIILAAHRKLLQTHPAALLILVPRHPERFNGVHELCRREGFAVCAAPAAGWAHRPRCCSATPWASCCLLCPGRCRLRRRQPGRERRAQPAGTGALASRCCPGCTCSTS
jgi:3-deoxy-D-manno-octulosonic-acid transferase